MSWRVVIVANRAKLEFKLNYLVIRSEETVRKVFLGEISVLIIESTAVALTAALLCELVKRKIKVVFCDEKRNPCSELIPHYGCHDVSARLKEQLAWPATTKVEVWTSVVRNKIEQQKQLLQEFSLPGAELLEEYLSDIQLNDTTNREGHAAKVYFNSLFGLGFSRSADDCTNAALNYGYAVIMSAFNREIVANGYLTQLGLFHDNTFNPFNFTSDVMEPFRPLVDRKVLAANLAGFGPAEKALMVGVLNDSVLVAGEKQYVNNAIKIYCKSIFDALNQSDPELIRFYSYEF